MNSSNNQSTSASHSSNRSPQKSIASTSSVVRPSNTQQTTSSLYSSSSSSSNQGISSQSFTVNLSTRTDDDTSDSDDTACQVINVKNEVICISSDSEDSVNENIDKLIYCSICKKKQNTNHNCSQYNKEFSTCLVPNCNILSRSIKDITPHYRQHMALPSNALLCQFCYQPVQMFECDNNGRHMNCVTINVFKCYTCNMRFNSMAEFANHKLKTHKCQLINHAGNYLCLFCENSSSDLMMINEHMKNCRDIIQKVNDTKVQSKPIKNKAQLFSKIILNDETNVPKSAIELKRLKEKKNPRSSQHVLFTCIKPSCNLIFYNFSVFKFHHRKHFEIGNNELICWQCCSPFSNLNCLRLHQVRGNCVTPGMFKCCQCDEGYDDIQSLSVHKYTVHDGNLIISKKGKKSMMCAFCRIDIDINYFKEHLVNCASNNMNKIPPKPTLLKKGKWHKCSICGKICLTAAALSSHKKVHNSSSPKKPVRKRISNTSNSILKTEHQLANTSNSAESISDIVNQTSSTSQINDMNTSTSDNMDNTIDSIVADEEINRMSSISSQCETSKINYDIFPFAGGFYSCILCSKKFAGKMGLSRHWPFCSKMRRSNYELPQNYYCTKCEENYNRITFGHHWKINHGKRLSCQKNKRFSCTKCPFKFAYKIALSMHNEHVHGCQENSVLNNTVDNDLLPNVTMSSARNNIEVGLTEDSEFNTKIEYGKKASTSKMKENDEVNIKIEHDVNEQDVDIQTVDLYDSEMAIEEQIINKNAVVVDTTNTNEETKNDKNVNRVDNVKPIISGLQTNSDEVVAINSTQNINKVVNEDKM